MTKTLLQKAQKVKVGTEKKRYYDDEDLEVVMAILDDKVNLQRVSRTLNFKSGSTVYTYIMRVLRQYIAEGKLKMTMKPRKFVGLDG